jgi:opacity protein-like surface antigen
MSRTPAILSIALALAVPVSSAAAGLDVRFGGFLPRAESNLFDDDAELYTIEPGGDDWRGFTGGAEFSARLGDLVELGFHVDGYSRTVHTSYRDFVSSSGREITQSLKLQTVPVGISLRLAPGGRHARVVPYAAVGGDLVFYKYEEFGDFIDFDSPNQTIIADSFVSEGMAPGFHVAGGVRFGLTHDFSLTGEVRYLWAKDDMGDDFRGNEIDLSGASVTVGLNVRF